MSEGFTRSTKQRTIIIDLLARLNRFVSAQELHAALRQAGSTIGLSTVYRNLATLTKAGDIDIILREDGEALYRSCSPQHHHHLLCKSCGTTVEITAELVEAWSHDIAHAHGFSDVQHTVEIVGLCRACRS
jgi:Fur family ferric uptake transcriptional regulator